MPVWWYPLAAVGWLGPPLAIAIVATVRSRRQRRSRPMLFCAAVDGPCDGRDWFLPHEQPIWLQHGDQRHLYTPDTDSAGPVLRYHFTGRSAPIFTSSSESSGTPISPG